MEEAKADINRRKTAALEGLGAVAEAALGDLQSSTQHTEEAVALALAANKAALERSLAQINATLATQLARAGSALAAALAKADAAALAQARRELRASGGGASRRRRRWRRTRLRG